MGRGVSDTGDQGTDDHVFGLECPHCDEPLEVHLWTGEAPIFCPMCGIDVNEEYEEY